MMEILREKPLTRLIFGILFLYLLCVSTAYSQDTLETKRLRIAASIKTVDTLEYPEDHSLLIDVAGNPVGFEVWEGIGKEAKKIVYLNAGNRFAVESFLGTLISSGGNTILKYRCEANIMPTSRASFILYSSEGDVLTTNYNHSTNAVIAMSGDGYFAIAGARNDTEDANRTYLTVFSPTGDEILSKPLDANHFATKMSLRDNARAIALTLTNPEKDSDGMSDIHVYDRSGTLVRSLPDYKYVNTLKFAGRQQQYLVAFSINSLVLINAEDGEVIWNRKKFYRLVGPFGLNVSEGQDYLSIVTAELDDKGGTDFTWRANLVSLSSGRLLGSVDIEGKFPVSRTKVIEWISERSFKVSTPFRDVSTVSFD